MSATWTRESVIEAIRVAREEGDRRPFKPGEDLSRLDLCYVDLSNLDLSGVRFWGTNLWRANLRWADLQWADLRGADLRGADLWRTDLRRGRLDGAFGVLQIVGLPSGMVTMVPTVDGWRLLVGLWEGTIDDLAEIIPSDEGLPEPSCYEVSRRRPSLYAVVALARAYADLNPDDIAEVIKRWGSQSKAEGDR